MPASDPPRPFEGINHPILPVKGRPALIYDLRRLWLDERTEAFSVSVCDILADASRLNPPKVDGLRVVDARTFLDALLEYSARWQASHTERDLKSTLLSFISKEADARGSDTGGRSEKSTPDGAGESNDETVNFGVASPWLTEVLAEAARFAFQREGKPVNTGVNETVIAALATAPFQNALFPADRTQRSRQSAFSRLRNECADALSQSSDPHQQQWMDVLDGVKAVAPPGPVAESERYFVADRPLDTLQNDVLGTSEDARALAEVMCLRTPGPPLAVGLFGDWGSGKSTFMNMLEAAIEEITAKTSDAAEPPVGAESESPFIRKAVHIRFNAWTYNDANLWASLASEFFQQLRAGGHRPSGEALYSRLVARVARRVAEAEGQAADAADQAVAARARVRELNAEIRDLEERQRRREDEMLAKVGTDLVTAATAEANPVRAAIQALGYDAPSDPTSQSAEMLAKRLSRDIEDLARVPGQVSALWHVARLVFARKPEGTLGWSVWLSGILLPILLLAALTTGALGPLMASLVPALVALGSLWRITQPILAGIETRLNELDRDARADRKALTEKRGEVAERQRAAAIAETKFVQAETEATRFRGGTPRQVLEFFLGESKEVRSLQDELGTVSRVRRAFEELNAIMAAGSTNLEAERDEGTDESPPDREPGSEPDDQGAGASETTGPALPQFDRIVIYIDDLDRCRADQVVKVLEAVHLLLAFPLFVVVVGVDPRWLVNSLHYYYEKELGSPGRSGNTAEDLRAVPKEYLEKIFQIPISLRELSQGEGGTYEQLILSIIGPREGPAGELESGRPAADGGEKLMSIEPLNMNVALPQETIEETTRRIAMRTDEIAAITAVGPLAGTSPRAVKRLVNVYRFVRGLYRGDDLDSFLKGGRGRHAQFAAVLFWLAVDSGMPAKQVHHLRTAVSIMSRTCTISDLALPVSSPDSKPSKKVPETAWSELVAFWSEVPPHQQREYRKSLGELEKSLPGAAGFMMLKETMEETSRFSFASVHVDRVK